MALKLPSTGESGCSSKLRATDLVNVLDLSAPNGFAALSGDSGPLNFNSRLVSTIDTITAMTRTPEVLGKVAVTHAFGDIYASGATPTDANFSLGLDHSAVKSGDGASLAQSIRKTLSVAGVGLTKAHTYQSSLIEITLSVVGRRNKLFPAMRKSLEYDLVLTKPLGAGTVCHDAWLREDRSLILKSEHTLQVDHRPIRHALLDSCIRGTTDISGFGLLGHLIILAYAQICTVEVSFASLPFMKELDAAIAHTSGNCSARRNEEDFDDYCDWSFQGSSLDRKKTYAAETSGPLLCIVNKDNTSKLLQIMQQNGFEQSCQIGIVKKGNNPRVKVH
ncbi:selenide, water dikinase [Nitrospira sp. KM1]|uniref:AIR synthase-related protein n=1 Tax=Nitrospira sp. KM1 TaxID=1936990 RepID=UPI0013A740FC|nr:AIR synthase-related protein [Nitrospira sp. KM1]BCA53725.1 selenide, water dikinase [Nitrospira sp. KM1]